MIYSNEAIVTEYVTPLRANIQWLMKRSFRMGNFSAMQYINNRRITPLNNLIKKCVRLLFYIISCPFTIIKCVILWDTLYVWTLLINASEISGAIISTFNVRYEDYKHIDQ
jgi:hypothetical protein